MWTKVTRERLEQDFNEFVKRNNLTKLVDEDPVRTLLIWIDNEVYKGKLIVKKDEYYRR